MKNPPTTASDIVVIGASTGGVEALRLVVAGLPSRFPAAIIIVMHIGAHESILPSLLAGRASLPVRAARHGDLLEAGRVLVAPPDFHLTLQREGAACRVVLARTAKENFTRPAIDPLFRSAAASYGPRAIGVILTGTLDDGTAGSAAIKACGGRVVVQDPDEALAPDMPLSVIENVVVDHVLRLKEIPGALARLIEASSQMGASLPEASEVPNWVALENRFAIEGVAMEGLNTLAKPSTFTCPECNGALWELSDQRPRRFRCHTGHAYTERNLIASQSQLVENSIWFAMRTFQEKRMLLNRMAEDASRKGRPTAADEYAVEAKKAQQGAEVLRELINQLPEKFIDDAQSSG